MSTNLAILIPFYPRGPKFFSSQSRSPWSRPIADTSSQSILGFLGNAFSRNSREDDTTLDFSKKFCISCPYREYKKNVVLFFFDIEATKLQFSSSRWKRCNLREPFLVFNIARNFPATWMESTKTGDRNGFSTLGCCMQPFYWQLTRQGSCICIHSGQCRPQKDPIKWSLQKPFSEDRDNNWNLLIQENREK